MALLSEEERRRAGEELRDWQVEAAALEREFVFEDFVAAMGFVNRVAELAEQHGHHPDIEIRYNRVRIRTWSHDSGGVTERDVRLAQAVDAGAKLRG